MILSSLLQTTRHTAKPYDQHTSRRAAPPPSPARAAGRCTRLGHQPALTQLTLGPVRRSAGWTYAAAPPPRVGLEACSEHQAVHHTATTGVATLHMLLCPSLPEHKPRHPKYTPSTPQTPSPRPHSTSEARYTLRQPALGSDCAWSACLAHSAVRAVKP